VEILLIIAPLLSPHIALVRLLVVEMMAHTGLKRIMKIRSLRLGNFTREMQIMIVGVMIIGLVMAVVSEPLILQ
jgi:hypothetical protein